MKSPGSIIATLLSGAWRQSPPTLEVSVAEIETVTPLLLASRGSALSWRRIKHSELETSLTNGELHWDYRFYTVEASFHERQIREVLTLLRGAGVEPILIKGWAIARLYPEVALRPYGDIDLCVRPDCLSTAEALLKRPENQDYNVDLTHCEATTLDRRSWDELYERSQLVKLGDVEVRVLGAEDHLRLLCIHLLKHGASRPLWLCDVALAMETRASDFDWDLFVGHQQPQADWVSCAIGLAHRLLGLRIDDTPLADRAGDLPGWLLKSVLKKWSSPEGKDQQRMGARLRSGEEIFKALLGRWPDPITASIERQAKFAETSRLPQQLSTYLAPSRIRKFLRETPGLLKLHQRT